MERFLRHLSDPAPGFECYVAGDKDEKPDLKVRVRHRLGKPASAEALKKIQKALGDGCDEVKAFYARYDGADLYLQGPLTGIAFYPVEQWEKNQKEWQERVGDIEEEDRYDFQKNGTVFGEVTASGNYFVWYEGQVYYDDHDGGDDTVFSPSFSQLLERLASDPAQFLNDVGCYTRYSDGKTDKQWIPMKYIPDMGKSAPSQPAVKGFASTLRGKIVLAVLAVILLAAIANGITNLVTGSGRYWNEHPWPLLAALILSLRVVQWIFSKKTNDRAGTAPEAGKGGAPPKKAAWKTEFQALWDKWVPDSGQADTVQGELVRVIGKLTDEAYRNGNGNWDEGHRRMAEYLRKKMDDKKVFNDAEIREMKREVDRLLDYENPDLSEDDSCYYRLTEKVVRWCLAQKNPIPNAKDPDLER